MLRISHLVIALILLISCNNDSHEVLSTKLFEQAYALNDVIEKDGFLIFAGGDTWTKGMLIRYELETGQVEELDLHHSIFLDIHSNTNACFTIGIDNQLFTSDDGLLWSNIPLDSNFVARDLCSTDTHLISVGGLANFKGQVQRVSLLNYEVDNNITFFTHQLDCISTLGNGDLIAAGFGAIYISFDQGISWHIVDYAGDHFQDIIQSDEAVYILGQGGLIYKSKDGIDFEKIRSYQISNPGFRRIYNRSNGDLLIIGDAGRIEQYHNDEWTALNTGFQSDFQCLIEINERIYIGTKQGEILEIKI